ncbi:endothelin-converting enzyme 1-like isoform X1 [Ornithodoros turicata]|uniref:endothelin-converting enzyme 1-like isoform X1 n=1 Tax=Ornithodoros turicata TaxID=34597 RepID=UPI003138EE14
MSADNNKAVDEEKAEPRENDKCMDDAYARNHRDKGPKGMSKLGAQVTSAVSNIPALVIVLLCVLLFVFFIIIIVLAVQINQGDYNDSTNKCFSAECLSIASQVMTSLNQSHPACDDFYTYSCGGFVSQHQLGRRTKVDVAEVLKEDVYHIVRNAIDLIPQDAWETSPQSKVKRFYQACMEDRSITADARSVFVSMLRKAGGWSIMRASSWSVQSWDKDFTLKTLVVDYGVTPFFRIGVTPDVHGDPSRNAIRVDPAGFAFPSYEYYMDSAPKHYKELVQAYKDFIEKVADLMRDERPSHQTSNIADYVASYERRLLERLDTPGNNTVMFERRTVYNLTHILPVIKWQRLLEAYFPSTPISMEMPIYLTHPHYFDELGKIISTTDTHTLNHYVIWRMVMKYAPHLDKPIRSLYYKFMQKLHGAEDVNLPEEEWWEQCVRHTSHYLGHAVGELYVNQYKDKEKVLEKAKEIAKNVKRASEKTLSHVDWIQDKRQVKEKIGDVDVELGYSNIITDSRYLEEYYKDFIVKLGSHLENVFEGERFLRMKEAEELSQAPGTSIDQVWTTYPQNAVAQYIYERNSVLVPLAVLQKPTFSLSQLKSIQYGSLGSLIATHIFKALDKKGLDMGPQLMEDSTRRIYTEKLQCLAESYPDATVNGEKIDGSRTSGEAFADIAGVKSAFLAFKEAEESTGALPALDLSPEQLFFVGYAQSMCENIRDDRVINANATSTSAPNRLRVLLTVQQLPEFSTAFGCAYDSQVQTAKKCNVW